MTETFQEICYRHYIKSMLKMYFLSLLGLEDTYVPKRGLRAHCDHCKRIRAVVRVRAIRLINWVLLFREHQKVHDNAEKSATSFSHLYKCCLSIYGSVSMPTLFINQYCFQHAYVLSAHSMIDWTCMYTHIFCFCFYSYFYELCAN